MSDTWKNLVVGLIVGGCLGFGGSQMTFAQKVIENRKDTDYLLKRVEEVDTRTEKRIEYVIGTINTAIKQNSEFLAVLREQNALARQLIENKKP